MSLQVSPENWLKEDPLFEKVFRFFQSKPGEVYLVGGYLRDKILGRKSKDIDLLLKDDISKLGPILAKSLKGSFFFLDETRGIARIIAKTKNSRSIDFTPLKQGLKEDLKGRDFTIDALALNLNLLGRKTLSFPEELIDYSHGFSDLKERKIRVVSPQAFGDDPLRLLRAVRIGAELGFEIEKNTADLLKRHAPLLVQVAPERVQEELFLILSVPKSSEAFKQTDSLGLSRVVLPELERCKGVIQDRFHHLDVWGHSLLTLAELERVTADIPSFFLRFEDKIKDHLKKEVQGRPRMSLLKLGALFHDLGKAQTRTVEAGRIRFLGHPETGAKLAKDVLTRLKTGKRAVQVTCRLVKEHLRPGFLSDQEVTSRAIHRFLRDCGEESLGVILLSLADRLASRGPASTAKQLKKHLSFLNDLVGVIFAPKRRKPTPILNGKDLMEKFGLEPGPLIGQLLKAVEEAQFEGVISRREEALIFVKQILEKGFD